MLFNNYTIFVYITLFIVSYNLLKRFVTTRSVRNLVLTLGNLLILLTVVKEHSIIVISVISLLVFIVGKLLQTRKIRWLYWSILLFILALFSIRNYEAVQSLLNNSFLSVINGPVLSVQKVGLSYILFRLVHYLVDSYKSKIQNSDLLTFLSYIFFFPSFLAGPIDQYNNFHYWMGNSKFKYQTSLFFAGISRIFIGAIKTLLIVPLLVDYATDYTVLLTSFSPILALAISLIAYSFYIYFEFSGYSDIAIGTAYLIGIKTPENFNNPYISQNLAEFWKRWHITFSYFLMIYVFKPIVNGLNKIINPDNRLLVSVIGYLLTFLICGLWHGSTLGFLVWGLFHGLGLAINKIWTSKLKPASNFFSGTTYKLLSITLTFVFVSSTWLFFNYPLDQVLKIFASF